jgi:hypothetical protein
VSVTEAFGLAARVGERVGERTEQKAEWSGGFGNSAKEHQWASQVSPVWRRSIASERASWQVLVKALLMGELWANKLGKRVQKSVGTAGRMWHANKENSMLFRPPERGFSDCVGLPFRRSDAADL